MNPLRRLLPSLAILGALAIGTGAMGQTQAFARKTKTIRAAVLLLDADKLDNTKAYGQAATPFTFYNLDRASGVKPEGWTFVNPYAPGTVSQDIRNRYLEWYGLTEPSTDPRLPTVGTSISKRNGAYWTVRLAQLNEGQMSNYDVLLVSPRFQLSLNPNERERLRRFVDGGGVLWIDLGAAPAVDKANNVPLAFESVAWDFGGYRDASSPLLNGIRTVSDGDLNLLNGNSKVALQPISVSNADPVGGNYVSLVGEFLRYRWISSALQNRNDPSSAQRPVIAEANLGDGTIVVTARGAASLLNGDTSPFLNTGYSANNVALNAGGRAAARLATNIVAMGANYRQPGGGSRKSGSATTDPSSPVLSRFSADISGGAYGPGGVVSGVPTSAPVTYKGFLVATVGNRIVVFDATPGRDLDGDGDEDDGIVNASGAVQDAWRDTSVGKQMDVVWVSQPLTDVPLSSPVCAEVPEAGGGMVDQILVTDSAGVLHGFRLSDRATGGFRLVGGERPQVYQVAPPTSGIAHEADPVTGQAKINPPTVFGNLAYIADATSLGGSPVGRVWVVDLSMGQIMSSTGAWYVGGTGVAGNPLPGFTSGATVGYIPIGDNSGGVDRVLYAPGIVGTNNQPGFVSLWLGAKGESPANIDVDETAKVLHITTRAGSNGQLPILFAAGATSPALRQLHPRLTVLDSAGNPLPLNDWVTTGPQDGGPGVINFGTNKLKTNFDTVTLRIDYAIDWGKDPINLTSAIERGRLLLPIRKLPSPDAGQRILGPIALTTRGTLHMIEGPNSPTAVGGSYFAIREDAGRGSFRVVSRYSLYNAYNQTFASGGQTFPVPPVLQDVDAVQNVANFPPAILGAPLSGFRYAGGVTLRNGIAYTAINANHGVIPVTMVAAFKAEPETAELKLGTNLPANPRLTQTDWARSNPGAIVQTPAQSTLAGLALSIDSDNGIIRLENLATVTRNEITDCISLSQPVGVGGDTRAYTLRQPDAFGDHWSPLLWYGLWNGGIATSAPLVAGNEVFLAANSTLPTILSSGFTNFTTSSAVLWSVDADVPTTGTFATPVPNRPWLIQATQIVATASGIDVSPYYRMPQNRGVTSFQDWVLRLNQTKLGTSTVAYGVAGGEGVVAAWGNQGLYGLSRADFIVADQGRLLRVDSSGNPNSSAFGGRFTGIGNGGGAAEYHPLVRPVKAYPVGSSEFLVVDAGGNRVVRLDDDGTELRSIDRIALDPVHKPDAYRANDPLKLKDPRDAATYEGYVYKGATDVVSSQQPVEYWVRYIIADSGNGRIVELADRFNVDSQGRVGAPITIKAPDPETGVSRDTPQVGVLVWQSPSLELTTKTGDYYNSISRVFVGSLGTGRYVYVAGVGRTRPTRAAAGLDNPNAPEQPSGAAGGAVVVFDPLGGVRVFDRFSMPTLAATKFLVGPTPGAANGSPGAAINFQANPVLVQQGGRPFSGLTAVTAATTIVNTPSGSEAGLRIMVTDADAVYEFAIASSSLANANAGGVLDIPTWMINEASFTALRSGPSDASATQPANSPTRVAYTDNPRFFRPAYARRLDSGDVLVVNGYRGLKRDLRTEYLGEVVLLDGTTDYGYTKQNFGFGLSSIHFELPPLTGIRGLVSPVFADRR